MKKQWISQLVISISLILIILSQIGFGANWSELSSLRQGIYIALICIWALHLITFVTATVFSNKAKAN
ncbi:hypothetical protein AB986_12725 [Alkalihalobacillus macyae]|uniref:Uncharacterized protein n=1 Tax=Guptibacillus hwajinpoensis TaxID=208199 RepID=A0A0J6CUB7_9BACL|nr:hypothetical protein AB986_12725 [Alkalihalobacillus macyae]